MKKEKIISFFRISLSLVYGETGSYDRWRWINKNIPKKKKRIKAVDLGCGRGTYVIGLSRKGYNCDGVSHDKQDMIDANKRRKKFGLKNCSFRQVDLRKLDEEVQMKSKYDVVVCSEVIEHIVDDEKLLKDISEILKKGGVLLLNTPYDEDAHNNREPWRKEEDGAHVRAGYNERVILRMCKENGLKLEKVGYCTGILSKKANELMLKISEKNYVTGRVLIVPIKIIYPLFDGLFTRLSGAKYQSICVLARKK